MLNQQKLRTRDLVLHPWEFSAHDTDVYRTKPEFSVHERVYIYTPGIAVTLSERKLRRRSLMDSECPAANVQPSVEDGTTASGTSQAARSRRTSESAEARERRLGRAVGNVLPQKQRRRGRGVYLSAESGTEHGVQPARRRPVRHAFSSGGVLSGKGEPQNPRTMERSVLPWHDSANSID